MKICQETNTELRDKVASVHNSTGFQKVQPRFIKPSPCPCDVLVEVKAATKREDTLLTFLVKGAMIEKPTN